MAVETLVFFDKSIIGMSNYNRMNVLHSVERLIEVKLKSVTVVKVEGRAAGR